MLIIPYKHAATLDELSQEARAEIMEVIPKCIHVAEEELGSCGTNVGINLGEDAGASKPDHIHIHVLPRFKGGGGISFMQTLAETRIICHDMHKVYNELKKAFQKEAPTT